MQLKIYDPPTQIKIAISLIETIKKKNKFTYDLTLLLDYNLKYEGQILSGLYLSTEPNCIRLNPSACDDKASFTYTEDDTMFGVIIHEFSHFLSMTYFVDFQKDYLEAFPENRFLVTTYDAANEDYDEEIAEIMSLYIRNPFLLKQISEQHYIFFKSWFTSPTSCTIRQFMIAYNKMPVDLKNELRTKWGVVVNHAERKVFIDEKEIIKKT